MTINDGLPDKEIIEHFRNGERVNFTFGVRIENIPDIELVKYIRMDLHDKRIAVLERAFDYACEEYKYMTGDDIKERALAQAEQEIADE